MRFALGLLIRLLLWPFYRIRAVGLGRLPTGAALLIGEHFTPFDAALIKLLAPGDVLCIACAAYSRTRIARLSGALVVDPDAGPAAWTEAFSKAEAALKAGRKVCLLIDAHLSKPGHVHALEAALKQLSAPVIPLAFEGPWSNRYKQGVEEYRLPRKGRAPVSLYVGNASESADPDSYRKALHELESEVWIERKRDLQPLAYSVVSRLRENRGRMALADPVRGGISRLKTLTGAVAIARAMRKHWGGQKRVGFLLPPSVGGALANLAAMLSGRVIVNLNYTTGADGMSYAAKQAEIKTVLTSKQFLHKGKIEPPPGLEVVYLEDVARTISGGARLFALLIALFAPYEMLRNLCGKVADPGMDDVHAIIFSSGSTGEPKGIQVTHFNLISNIEGAARQIDLDSSDRLLHMLPYFHTFGNLLLWAGIHWGAAMIFLPNPLDAEQVGQMTEGYGATLLVATPTFLQLYSKRCTPAQFGTLRIVVAGAEKLPQPFAEKFAEKFGLEISEGYGCTECSPVIGVNAPSYRRAGVMQVGARRGTIGRALPGIQVRIVDPDTNEPMPLGEPGMLLVKGPNVMPGYLGAPEKTSEVLKDGWYTTGDIVKLEPDGFLTITDRLSRFSKIGGEMVPHGKVEEALHAVISSHEQVFAVTCIRDEKKGERLAVLYCQAEFEVDHVVKELQGQGLPNIFIPKPRDFIQVDALPVLGTGKMDLRAMKQIAIERLSP